MGWRWFFLCLMLVGCIQAQLQPCGDLLCPVDSVCLPNNTCATKESIDVCTGKAEGGTCTTVLFTGSCVAGVCTAPVCGDGVVSGSEQCDGPVSGIDCVDYGFDTGIPTCSERCGLDVVGSCVRFGWERILDVAVAEGDLYVGAGRIAVITEDHRHVQLYEGGQLIQDADVSPNAAYWLAGNGSTVVAAIDGAVLRSQDGGAFERIDTKSLYDDTPQIVAGDDGTMYLGAFDSATRVYKSRGDGGWDKIEDVSTRANRLFFTGGTLIISRETGAVDRYTGSGWTNLASPADVISSIVARPGGGFLFSVFNSFTYEIVNGVVSQFSDYGPQQLFTIGQDVYGGGAETWVQRDVGGINDRFDTPIYGTIASDGTDLYIAGNGVFRFTGMQLAVREGIGTQARDAKLLGNGRPVLTTLGRISMLETTNYWSSLSTNDQPYAAAGASETDLYVAEGDFIEHYNGSNMVNVTLPPGVGGIWDVEWQTTTNRLYAIGDSGLAMYRNGTNWTLITGIPATCNLARVVVYGAEVYAAGACGTEGAIWQLGATTATEIHHTSSPLASLAVDTSGNLYAAGTITGVLRIAGAWTDEPNARGVSISATGPNDIWVGGGPTELNHFDGTQWSRVRLVGAARPHMVALPRFVYIAGASSSVLLR